MFIILCLNRRPITETGTWAGRVGAAPGESVCEYARWDRQTDGRTPDQCIVHVRYPLETVSIINSGRRYSN